jgi:hypothetical protein
VLISGQNSLLFRLFPPELCERGSTGLTVGQRPKGEAILGNDEIIGPTPFFRPAPFFFYFFSDPFSIRSLLVFQECAAYCPAMIKTVRKGSVKDQDAFRRADMKAMSPSMRLQALVELRDRAFSYEPLRRVAMIRKRP